MKGSIIKFRIFLWLILAMFVVWFLYMGIVPFGKISYHLDPKKESSFIGKIAPAERVQLESRQIDKYFSIIGDPVYFSLYTPRRFDSATVKYRYRLGDFEEDPFVIESGVLVDKMIWRYNLKPAVNTIIDKYMEEWNAIKDGQLILLQRNKQYDSIKEFTADLPELNKIALYNYKISAEYILKDYQSRNEERYSSWNLENDLRGPYQFYTYIKDEELNFQFSFQDLNMNKDSDDINIHLYYNDQLIVANHLEDDGIVEDRGEITDERLLSLNIPNLPEGVYKIELRCGDDIITKNIKTVQEKLSFISNIRLMKSSDNDLKLYTDSNIIYAKTVNPDRLQTLTINDDELEITKTYSQFEVKIDKGTSSISQIYLEKDGVIIAGNGVFSFSENGLINPNFKKVDQNLVIDEIDYILAEYQVPVKDKDWNISEITVDMIGAYREDSKYNFIISIPGLKIDDGRKVEISDIWIDLEGRSIFDKISNFIK